MSIITFLQRFKRYGKYLFPLVFLMLLLWGGIVVCRVNLSALVRGIPRGIELLGHMLPPAWDYFPQLVGPAVETLQIAFVGTAMGTIFAFLIGLLAAGNINQNRALREIARGLLSAERALPDLITVLFFVTIVGLGAFPGVMAVAVSSIGMLGKLFADAIEELDPRPLEALKAIGTTENQIIRYAVIPQVAPSLITNTLYRLDANVRMSIFLGAVGAGGIGFDLVNSMRMMRYDEAMSAIVVILLIVTVCEKSSDWLRGKIIGQEVLQ